MITFSSWLPDAGTRLSTLAIELPRSITPAVAGLTVGLFVGVVGVIAVFVFVGRGQRRSARRARLGADEVVFIPPYGTMRRDTPLPPRVFASAETSSTTASLRDMPAARASAYAHAYAHAPNAHQSFAAPGAHAAHAAHAPHAAQAPVPGYGFRPSSALSARVLAKMGYEFDEADDALDLAPGAIDRASEIVVDSPSADPLVSIDVVLEDDSEVFAAAAPVLVSPVLVVAAADASAPHPLGIIKSTSAAMRPASDSVTSSAMRAAPIADLSFDDSPTEIGETYFDEPPQPRRRTDPPRIRPVVPAGPRFADRNEKTPRMPQVTAAKNDGQHP